MTLLGPPDPLIETVSMTTSCPAGIGGVKQGTPLALTPALKQLVAKGWRAGLSWSLVSVATAACTARGLSTAMPEISNAHPNAPKASLADTFIGFLLFMAESPRHVALIIPAIPRTARQGQPSGEGVQSNH